MRDKKQTSMPKEKEIDWKDRYMKLAKVHNAALIKIEDALFNLQAYCKNNRVN